MGSGEVRAACTARGLQASGRTMREGRRLSGCSCMRTGHAGRGACAQKCGRRTPVRRKPYRAKAPYLQFFTIWAARFCSMPLPLVASKLMRAFSCFFTSLESLPSENPITALSMSWNSASP